MNKLNLANMVNGHPLNFKRVGWWLPVNNLSGGSKLFDMTLNKLHGTVVNNPNFTPKDRVSKKIKFLAASNQYVNLGNPLKLQFSGSQTYTIKTRYKLITAPSTSTSYQLFSKDKDTGGRAYTTDISAGPVSFGCRFYVNGGGVPLTNEVVENVTPAAGDEKISYSVFDYDGYLRLYVYNVNTGTFVTAAATSAETTPSASSNVFIGRREYSGYEENIDGFIIESSVWSRPFTKSDFLEDVRHTILNYTGFDSPLSYVGNKSYFVTTGGVAVAFIPGIAGLGW